MRYLVVPSRRIFCLVLAVFILLGGCVKRPPADALAPPRTMTPPAQLMKEVLKGKQGGNLISGGWGYSREEALVLGVAPDERSIMVNAVPLEYALIDLRNVEEFTRTPKVGERYDVIKFETASQTFTTGRDRLYDHIRGLVYLVAEKDVPIVALHMENAKKGDRQALEAIKAKTKVVQRDYWFDITAPFNHTSQVIENAVPRKGAQAEKRAPAKADASRTTAPAKSKAPAGKKKK